MDRLVVGGWLEGWIDNGWIDRRTSRWVDGRMDRGVMGGWINRLTGQVSKWLPRGIALAGSFQSMLPPDKGSSVMAFRISLPFSCGHVRKGSNNSQFETQISAEA